MEPNLQISTGLSIASWIYFWILFFYFAVERAPHMPVLAMFVLLLLLRERNNELPKTAWAAFWLSTCEVWPLMFRSIGQPLFNIALLLMGAVRVFAIRPDIDGEYYKMPPSVFWILVVVFSVHMIRRNSSGYFLWITLVMYNIHMDQDGAHLPGVLISGWMFLILIAIVTVCVNGYTMPKYLPAVFIFFAAVGLLHKQMWPWNEDFGHRWIAAWLLLYQAVLYVYAPHITFEPKVWYGSWTAIFALLGWAFRPDQSLPRFALWALTMIVLRAVGLFICQSYGTGPNRSASFFPFTLLRDTWRMSHLQCMPMSAWPLDERSKFPVLCERCDALTGRSKLIMGSTTYLSRVTEWHDIFWTRAEFTSMFGETTTGESGVYGTFSTSNCPLCCLLWHSMSTRRQKDISRNCQRSRDEPQLPKPKDVSAELRVKVWEERPLSAHTYMQLFWGDIAIGARLIVERDAILPCPSPSIRSDHTNSPAHFEQARKWLKLCRENHKVCNATQKMEPVRPERMLYASKNNGWVPGQPPATLRLVHTTDIDFQNTEYLALSHCWGTTDQMHFKLLASNIDECFQSIDFSILSQNMQDAITVMLRLGFSYIWIDSLCVIQQDDSGKETGDLASDWKQDWLTEAPKMGSVYSSAACTIASTGSSTSGGGCFHRRDPSVFMPCIVGTTPGKKDEGALMAGEKAEEQGCKKGAIGYASVRLDDAVELERGINLSPLNTRGWALQERLLSRRILHFGSKMVYWECGCRCASELNPHGYTYQRHPDDIRGEFTPDMDSGIETDRDSYGAEHESRVDEEMGRFQPSPVMVDPDDAQDSNSSLWLYRRGFWKNVVKPDGKSWDLDEQVDKAQRPYAAFRTAFEQLRLGLVQTRVTDVEVATAEDYFSLLEKWLGIRAPPEKMVHKVGPRSFSQVWYEIVEAYSRRQLTVPTDKLMAMKGIQDEVARTTRSTYLYGLWRERLVMDMLWFAIDGPGQRILCDSNDAFSPPVAPTWSWMSIEGAVALDLMPENAQTYIELEQTLVTVHGTDEKDDTIIELKGPMLEVPPPKYDSLTWSLCFGTDGQPSARFFPDVAEDFSSTAHLVCVPFVVLSRSKSQSPVLPSKEDVQGLVLRRVIPLNGDENAYPKSYERVGYFTTSYIAKSRMATRGQKTLKTAKMQRFLLAGRK